ncbi:hypothetical protein F4777DRAFT_579031 [Nemania sp. FL0916]|nr:hypothetical protein F4777DRAFT_579031 [Nemania sp. FL0916]
MPPRLLLPPHAPRLRWPIPISEVPAALRPRALVGATTVPQGYGNAPFGPDSGTVVGIVLGSVAGFLLLLAFIYWCLSFGQGPRIIEGSIGGGTASVVSWRSRPRGPPRKHHRRSRQSGRREKVVELRRERIPIPRVEREDQIIVEEFGSTPRSRSRPRSISRGPPLRRSVLNDGDDMIVVEEDPPSPRRNSMRSQRTRRGSFREDVYVRDVSRRRSGSRV